MIRRGHSFTYLLTPHYLKAMEASTSAKKTATGLIIWLLYLRPRPLTVTPY